MRISHFNFYLEHIAARFPLISGDHPVAHPTDLKTHCRMSWLVCIARGPSSRFSHTRSAYLWTHDRPFAVSAFTVLSTTHGTLDDIRTSVVAIVSAYSHILRPLLVCTNIHLDS